MGQQSKGEGFEYQADLRRVEARKARRLARPTQTQKDGAWRKPVHTPYSVSADTGLQSLGAYSNLITGTARAASVDSAGNFGYVASSRRFKTNIVAANLDPAVVVQIGVKHFEYIAEVAERDRRASLDPADPEFDADYPVSVQLGVIAEDLMELGLRDFVFWEADGVTPAGVHYEMLALAVLTVVQAQAGQLSRLEARMSALEAKPV